MFLVFLNKGRSIKTRITEEYVRISLSKERSDRGTLFDFHIQELPSPVE